MRAQNCSSVAALVPSFGTSERRLSPHQKQSVIMFLHVSLRKCCLQSSLLFPDVNGMLFSTFSMMESSSTTSGSAAEETYDALGLNGTRQF